MKFLCICTRGNVRSVAMAQYIKEMNGYRKVEQIKHEAIAISAKDLTSETKKMLKEWADIKIDMRDYLPKDLWHNPRHPELRKKVEEIWKGLAVKLHFA